MTSKKRQRQQRIRASEFQLTRGERHLAGHEQPRLQHVTRGEGERAPTYLAGHEQPRLQHIASGAGDFGHDRAVRLRPRVHEARLADVGPSDNGHLPGRFARLVVVCVCVCVCVCVRERERVGFGGDLAVCFRGSLGRRDGGTIMMAHSMASMHVHNSRVAAAEKPAEVEGIEVIKVLRPLSSKAIARERWRGGGVAGEQE